jgi:hypothetical protein
VSGIKKERVCAQLPAKVSDDLDLIVEHMERKGMRRRGGITRARGAKYAIERLAAQLRGQQGQAGG